MTQAQDDWRSSGKAFLGNHSLGQAYYDSGRPEQIMEKLIFVSPLRGHPIQLKITGDAGIHAATNGEDIFMSLGMLRAIGHDRSEVAAVLAHELGHIIARHKASRKKTSPLWNIATSLLGAVPFGGYASLALREGRELGKRAYSRYEEKEADAIAVYLAGRAGYDPFGLDRFLAQSEDWKKGIQLPTSIPITNYADPIQAAQGATLFFLHASPFYKIHPPTASRRKRSQKLAFVMTGQKDPQDLAKDDKWLGGIYDVMNRRSPS